MNSNSQIEASLKLLGVKKPPQSLDAKIELILGSVNQHELADFPEVDLEKENDFNGQPRFAQTNSSTIRMTDARREGRGWVPCVVTALVASLAGFLIGRFETLEPVFGDSAVSIATEAQRSSESNLVKQSDLTPVQFNVNAFRLLHGHSKLEEFSSCEACHTGKLDATSAVFTGWFYGDSSFFQKHVRGDISKCSECHTLESGEMLLPRFEYFKDSNCSTCHVVGQASQQKLSI